MNKILITIFLFTSFILKAQNHPNILWISVEDISPDIGCYGDENAHTPVLDQLAENGVKYINAIADAPVCAPARSTIITGMYPTSLGSQHMRCKGLFPTGFKYYPQLLRTKGYYCTNNSKEDYNLIYSSEEIWDDSGKKAHWRNRPDKAQPFFAIFNLTMTHESCINSKAKHDKVTKELNNNDGWVRLLAAQVLDEIGEDARPAEKELQKRIDVNDSNKYVVRVANRALNVMNRTNNVVK